MCHVEVPLNGSYELTRTFRLYFPIYEDCKSQDFKSESLCLDHKLLL
jgi:hypothetical protein